MVLACGATLGVSLWLAMRPAKKPVGKEELRLIDSIKTSSRTASLPMGLLKMV